MRSPGKIVRNSVEREPGLHLTGDNLRDEPQLAERTEQLLSIGGIARGTRERGRDRLGAKGARLAYKHAAGLHHTGDGIGGKATCGVDPLPQVGNLGVLARGEHPPARNLGKREPRRDRTDIDRSDPMARLVRIVHSRIPFFCARAQAPRGATPYDDVPVEATFCPFTPV